MKNKLSDLHNILFEQLERLNDNELKGEALGEELKRSKALTGVASQIIANGQLALRAKRQAADTEENLPPMLEAGE